jgi:hypothetical protein
MISLVLRELDQAFVGRMDGDNSCLVLGCLASWWLDDYLTISGTIGYKGRTKGGRGRFFEMMD